MRISSLLNSQITHSVNLMPNAAESIAINN